MKKMIIAAVIALAAATALAAQSGGSVQVYSESADACIRKAVFAHAVNPIPSSFYYYQASECEIVYADHVTVLLPQLTGGPKKITVRNVSNATVIVGAASPDVIDATVFGYSNINDQPWLNPGTAMLCCADQAFYIPAQRSATFEAYPGRLANSWFTTSDR
jgi:hypothetical protein